MLEPIHFVARLKYSITLALMLVSLIISGKVEITQFGNKFTLLRDGKPYYINGAGGGADLELLKKLGGNSIRTWGVDNETDSLLEQAKQLDITVCFGVWLGQERQGFDYNNKKAVQIQLEAVRSIVQKYKDHPAILVWGIGNELDLDYTNFEVWKHLEEICKVIKQEDPNHPIMTVTAGLDVAEVKLIQKHAPSIDILGLNTYGDISYLAATIKEYGWTKPYIVAEWGPYGWWEVQKTNWGAAIEETSSQKAVTYKKSARAILSDSLNCFGSYVFYWGQKQEHTSTWFGLFDEQGNRTEATDELVKNWSGNPPNNFVPKIDSFLLNDMKANENIILKKGSLNKGFVKINDVENDKIVYDWQVVPESTDKRTGGDKERAPRPIPGLVQFWSKSKNSISFKAPQNSGAYRLYLFARDGHGNVATGNIPFFVE